MAEQSIRFRRIEVQQPIGIFYVGAIAANDVLAISYADIRRIEGRDIERMVGIQRDLSSKRIRELQQYVNTVDAAFPTSIILAIGGNDATYDDKKQELIIRRRENVASIIDGQHRIAGLEGFVGNFDLNVTIFIDMDKQDQAMTFATINLAQTKVNRSLVYDLFEFQQARSPQKTCHNIARLLNREKESPLQNRIKILGRALTDEPFEFITQATFVDSLISYISKDPLQDRDDLRRKRALLPADGANSSALIFRDLFVREHDAEIARIVWNLFEAVSNRWADAWNTTEKGYILNRTQGFRALMRFLRPLYSAYADKKGKLPVDVVSEVLKGMPIKSSDFTTERYNPGTSGESQLYRDLLRAAGLDQ